MYRREARSCYVETVDGVDVYEARDGAYVHEAGATPDGASYVDECYWARINEIRCWIANTPAGVVDGDGGASI